LKCGKSHQECRVRLLLRLGQQVLCQRVTRGHEAESRNGIRKGGGLMRGAKLQGVRRWLDKLRCTNLIGKDAWLGAGIWLGLLWRGLAG
jgi:hypothetical protein